MSLSLRPARSALLFDGNRPRRRCPPGRACRYCVESVDSSWFNAFSVVLVRLGKLRAGADEVAVIALDQPLRLGVQIERRCADRRWPDARKELRVQNRSRPGARPVFGDSSPRPSASYRRYSIGASEEDLRDAVQHSPVFSIATIVSRTSAGRDCWRSLPLPRSGASSPLRSPADSRRP